MKPNPEYINAPFESMGIYYSEKEAFAYWILEKSDGYDCKKMTISKNLSEYDRVLCKTQREIDAFFGAHVVVIPSTIPIIFKKHGFKGSWEI